MNKQTTAAMLFHGNMPAAFWEYAENLAVSEKEAERVRGEEHMRISQVFQDLLWHFFWCFYGSETKQEKY